MKWLPMFFAEIKLTVLPHAVDYAEMDEVIAEIKADPELQQMLLESDEDIKAGRVYTAEETIQFLKEFHSK